MLVAKAFELGDRLFDFGPLRRRKLRIREHPIGDEPALEQSLRHAGFLRQRSRAAPRPAASAPRAGRDGRVVRWLCVSCYILCTSSAVVLRTASSGSAFPAGFGRAPCLGRRSASFVAGRRGAQNSARRDSATRTARRIRFPAARSNAATRSAVSHVRRNSHAFVAAGNHADVGARSLVAAAGAGDVVQVRRLSAWSRCRRCESADWRMRRSACELRHGASSA